MKLRFPTIDRRRIVVIIALIAPFFAVEMLSKMASNHPLPAPPKNIQGSSKDYPFLTLDYIKKLTAGSLEMSEKMTPKDYEKLRQNNPNFPPNLEEYRAKTKARMAELNTMTPKDWQDEVDRTIPPLRRSDPLPIKAPPENP